MKLLRPKKRSLCFRRLPYIPKEADSELSEAVIAERGKAAFAPISDFGYTLVNSVKMDDYWDGLQKMGEFGASYYYQKAVTDTEIPPDQLQDVVDQLCYYAETCPVNNMGTAIIITPMGGELLRTKEGTTATGETFKKMKWW